MADKYMDSLLALRMTAIFIGCLPLNPHQRVGIDGCHKKRRQEWRLYKKGGETPPLQKSLKI
jgi:hypothetical protein